MFDTTVAWTITAPASVDGRGQAAILNGPTSATDFVGYLNEVTRSISVRQSSDEIVEGHGAVFGPFYYGAATYTLTAEVTRSFTARDKLWRATEALAADGTIVFTETGGVAKRINFRRMEYPQGPDNKTREVLIALTSADARVYSNVALSSANPITNAGNANTPPTLTFTTPASGTVVLTNTTTSQALSLTVGAGYLTGSTSTIVDFGARTVTQGGVSKYQAVVFPTSVWWDLIPGSNGWSVGTATGGSISARSAWI